MTILFYSLPASADWLRLYVYPSPKQILWENPTQMARITLQNNASLDKHPIGHVNIEVECAGQDTIITGMTSGKRGESIRKLIREKYGLGILFYNLAGRMEYAKDIYYQFPKRYKNGKLGILSYKINARTCARLSQYYKEYLDGEYFNHYGLPNRPRYREGAGCSAYGASYVELAGLMTEELKSEWSHNIRVPEKWIGGHFTNRKVYMHDIVTPLKPIHWANENEAHYPLFFWDPDLMFLWIQKTWQQEMSSPTGEFQLSKRGKALELIANKILTPTPTEPIWLQ